MEKAHEKVFRLSKHGSSLKKERFCGIHFVPRNSDGSTMEFYSGEKYLADWPSSTSIQFLPEFRDVPASDILNCGCIASQHIVSSRLKSLLENELGVNRDRENVQFLPVHVHEKDNPANSLGTYYIINVLRVLNGVVDVEKSKMGYMAYLSVAMFRSKIAGIDIFKIPELELAVYVSSRVRRLMCSKKYGLNLTGVHFTEVKITEDEEN